MLRTLSALLAGATICAVSLLSADAQEPKKAEKPEIPGGIEGRVKSVNHDKQTLTIIASTGRERSFTVTEDTTMVGPRGGKVRRRLNDRRFHEGMELTIVPDGSTAKEIHLGYSRRESDDASGQPKSSASRKPAPALERSGVASTDKATKKELREAVKVAAKTATKTGANEEEEDEDDEIPGRVKSYDATRRVLVVTLLNGKSRSFFLSNDLKVVVRGTPSKQGLRDPALKADTPITVLMEPGGRRVKELHVAPALAARSKKAA
jgi:hypothetical protein